MTILKMMVIRNLKLYLRDRAAVFFSFLRSFFMNNSYGSRLLEGKILGNLHNRPRNNTVTT